MGIFECLFGLCLVEQTTLILVIVGAAVGGLFLGLLIGSASKSGEKTREIIYQQPPQQ